MDVHEHRKAVLTALAELFDALPKAKVRLLLPVMSQVELGLRVGVEALVLLDQLRAYFLDTSGEGSPFVQEIDKLLPRE